ncbi:uncharacterized protein LOC113281819 [Papaver somniferum]|uniref:uncharacterized protein LOC113281819 n=1 Tax=Papaver somniferum TaxID=3469 RepID=UPI000E6F860F|nr:uncharacterized protein LOC113281819 [Papaver somniferum]
MDTSPQTPKEIASETPPQTLNVDQKINPLRLPKAFKSFKCPERYMSPTDKLMSPVSKGLLARSKRPGSLIPPSANPPKILDKCFQDVGVSQV